MKYLKTPLYTPSSSGSSTGNSSISVDTITSAWLEGCVSVSHYNSKLQMLFFWITVALDSSLKELGVEECVRGMTEISWRFNFFVAQLAMEGTWVQGHLAALWTQRHKSVWLQDFHRTLFNTQRTSNSYPQDPLSDCVDHPAFQVAKYCFWEPGETNDQMHEWWALTNNSRIACLSEIKEPNLKRQSNTRAKCPSLLHCHVFPDVFQMCHSYRNESFPYKSTTVLP